MPVSNALKKLSNNLRPGVLLSSGRVLVLVSVLILGTVMISYLDFIHQVKDSISQKQPPASDAIVVLTGEADRLTSAINMLDANLGRRLLISGVNQDVSRDELEGHLSPDTEVFACCVDLDYLSQNTRDNAENASYWAKRHQFNRLLIVTSDYHMPRSLLMLKQTMPTVDLVPAAVPSQAVDRSSLLNLIISPTILREYGKYLFFQLGMEQAIDYLHYLARRQSTLENPHRTTT